jgi:hypothetical protein
MSNPSSSRPLLAGQRCQCTGCGQQFNRTTTFARHRVASFGTLRDPGGRRCLSTEEMQDRGWRLNGAGFWLGAPMPEEALPGLSASHAGRRTPPR